MGMERRFARGIEIREASKESGAIAVITGYAAVFNSRSVDFGGWREIIRPGAFKDVVEKNQDVRGLVGHDPRLIIGRRSAGTLKLSEDEKGLRYEICVPDTQAGRDTVTSIRRGDLDGSSFSFDIPPEGGVKWTRDGENGNAYLREVLLVTDVYDVGPVTFPAYEDATAELRSHRAEILEQAKRAVAPPAPPPTAKRDRIIRNFHLVTGLDLTPGKV